MCFYLKKSKFIVYYNEINTFRNLCLYNQWCMCFLQFKPLTMVTMMFVWEVIKELTGALALQSINSACFSWISSKLYPGKNTTQSETINTFLSSKPSLSQFSVSIWKLNFSCGRLILPVGTSALIIILAFQQTAGTSSPCLAKWCYFYRPSPPF